MAIRSQVTLFPEHLVDFVSEDNPVWAIEAVVDALDLKQFETPRISRRLVDLVACYKARFQIEFLFRDAKQFLGLNDCQPHKKKALHFHFNASMTALNLLKLEDRQQLSDDRRVISIASWRTFKANAQLLERFSSYLGMDFNRIKFRPDFERCATTALLCMP
ncbi:hypothetical protein ACLUEY_08200 [Vreelandella aquamarina]